MNRALERYNDHGILRRNVLSKGNLMTASRPTIYDVAQRAGVSKSLVSLVLRGSPKVSPERRRAVEEAIRALDYRPSRAATALAGVRTRNIGLVIDDFRNLWFVDLLDGMRDVLDPAGFQVSVADLRRDAHAVEGFIATHAEAVVVAAEPDAAALRIPVPVAVVGGRAGSIPGADTVANDDTEGARIATRHLLELGHRRIGHLTGGGGSAALRRAAYTRVMREAGLHPLLTGGEHETSDEGGYRAARQLLEAHPDVTAIFASNDVMALGAAAALRDRGLAIPHDVSLVGYDDSPLANSRYLSFTTIDDRSRDVGAETARAILARLDDPEAEPRHIRLSPTLIDRGSTAPPLAR